MDEASSGMECIEMTGKKQYDIIFLDHMMPDLDGIETLHRIISDNSNPSRNSPFIALTANAIVGAKEMYLSEGFDDFLSKPIDPDELEKMIVDKLPDDKVHHASAVSGASAPSAPVHDTLPEVQGIDWKYASLRFKNSDMLKQSVEEFYKMAGSEADKLQDFFDRISDAMEEENHALLKESLEQYCIRVHAMKSSSATIGAIWLSGAARLLEDASKNEDTAIITAVTPTFLDNWQHTIEALKPLCREEGSASMPITDENRQTVKNSLAELGNAMADMDIDTADRIIKELKEYIFPESLQERIEALDLAVTNLDDIQSVNIVNDILNNML